MSEHPSVLRLLALVDALKVDARRADEREKNLMRACTYWHTRFQKYGRHLESCHLLMNGESCTCGFIDYNVVAEATA